MKRLIPMFLIAAVAAFHGAGDAGMAVKPEVAIPPIDLVQSGKTETATFALG